MPRKNKKKSFYTVNNIVKTSVVVKISFTIVVVNDNIIRVKVLVIVQLSYIYLLEYNVPF